MSQRIPSTFIQDMLLRTDIVEIIKARLKLVKKGKEYLACCPFHDEKSPSFSVSPQKQFYYCFGCHAHGNAIGFLMQYDRMEFVEAVTYLANQLGIEIPVETSDIQQTDKSLYELLEKITTYYQRQLSKSSAAKQYLRQRQIDNSSIELFRLGYAPNQWDSLTRHIRNPEQQNQLIQSGMLIQKDNKRCYDRFRDRLIFPIRNIKGKVIAFGGRSLGNDLPKYINSPETPLFHKNRELFGLYEARQQDVQRFIMVEGYLDVIALAQFGIRGAVASLGTAINSQHLQLLLRYSKEIICCFDGDRAGHQAAWKFLTLSLPLLRDDVSIKFLFLPEGEDPDSLVHKEGQEGFNARLSKAIPLSTVFFTKLKRETPITSLDAKAKFAKIASEFLNKMPKGIMRKLFYKQMAELLEIDLKDLVSLVKNAAPLETEAPTDPSDIAKPVAQAITILLHYPKLAELTSPHWLFELELPGINLLQKLLETYRKVPILSTGGLLAYFNNPAHQSLIAKLAAGNIAIPPKGSKAEFEGALQRCFELVQQEKINHLINKAKRDGLSEQDRTALQQLLSSKAANNVE